LVKYLLMVLVEISLIPNFSVVTYGTTFGAQLGNIVDISRQLLLP